MFLKWNDKDKEKEDEGLALWTLCLGSVFSVAKVIEGKIPL